VGSKAGATIMRPVTPHVGAVALQLESPSLALIRCRRAGHLLCERKCKIPGFSSWRGVAHRLPATLARCGMDGSLFPESSDGKSGLAATHAPRCVKRKSCSRHTRKYRRDDKSSGKPLWSNLTAMKSWRSSIN
jgi:hypothetical protein